ncbi:MAG: S41 family peptidase [Verrucomicrobiales bacterium]|nr:S41 family peptidase [Verrucomicrobiales bacterium]
MSKIISRPWIAVWAALSLSPFCQAQQAGANDDGYEEIKLFTRVLETIREQYVDPEKASYEKLINSALEGMLADLDPHCQFMQPRVFEQLKENTDSTYQGIGITVSSKNERLTVITVREDGPAARAGLLPGDHILKVNDNLTDDVGLSEAINMLRGKPGEKLKLTVRRPATGELLEMEMVREVIVQSSVKDIMMLDPGYSGGHKIGYARILQFSAPTAKELADGLDELEKQGMEAFILDLRNNPGGLLRSAIDVCGEFVKAGTVVLTTEGKPGSPSPPKIYRTSAKSKRRDRDYPVVALLNHSSASASEVVAGALQDLKRCIVVGTTSFGKGSVQTILPIEGSNGKAIRLTTAKYYTPNHITIHENGVEPTIRVTLDPAEEKALMNWFRRDEMSPESRKRAEKFVDPQVERAADALKGVLVYSTRNKPTVAEAPAEE